MENRKIVMLAGEGFSTHAVYHALSEEFTVVSVVMEDKVGLKSFLKRRIKKLGWFTVIGQVLFQAIIVKYLNSRSKKRLGQLEQELNLNGNPIPGNVLQRVPSVNDEATITILKGLNPDLIIVNGTRIISKKVLGSVSCRFINTHTGITPRYRGVHGTYWALAENDRENSGVTVHLVDAGIDTGGILYQERVYPSSGDNFVTYPVLQLGAGIPILKKAVNDVFENRVTVQQGIPGSKLWYHPTIWQYLYNRIVKKIK